MRLIGLGVDTLTTNLFEETIMGALITERKFRRRILRIQETCKRTGLSKTTLWRKEKDGTFPRRVRLSERSSGHYEDEVDDWISSLDRVDLAGQKEGTV